MGSYLRFRTGEGEFALAVDHVREVRQPVGIRAVPSPGPGVVGLLEITDEAEPITVVAVFGPGRDHIVVVEVDDVSLGLFVEEVSAVVAVDDDHIGPLPAGQREELVSGTIRDAGELVLVLDARALAATLSTRSEP